MSFWVSEANQGVLFLRMEVCGITVGVSPHPTVSSWAKQMGTLQRRIAFVGRGEAKTQVEFSACGKWNIVPCASTKSKDPFFWCGLRLAKSRPAGGCSPARARRRWNIPFIGTFLFCDSRPIIILFDNKCNQKSLRCSVLSICKRVLNPLSVFPDSFSAVTDILSKSADLFRGF
jgi:hypothetical protein